MNDPIHFTLGLPFGQWPVVASAFMEQVGVGGPALERLHSEIFEARPLEALTTELCEALAATRPGPGRLDEWAAGAATGPRDGHHDDARLCWTAQALADQWASARFVVWIEHPAKALAGWLQAARSGADVSLQLAQLRSAALAMAQLVHRHPAQCLVIELDEALACPAALEERLAQWLGRASLPADTSAQPSLDPLALTLAARLTATDDALQRAYERLYASCVLLGGAAPAEPVTPDRVAVVLDAARSFGEMTAKALEAEGLRSQLREGMDAFQRVQAERTDATRESEELLLQLHQVQEELETVLIREQRFADQLAQGRKETDGARADVEKLRLAQLALQAERDQAQKELAQLRAKSSAAQALSEKLQQAQLASQGERDRARAECDKLRQQSVTLTNESDLLLVQLHQVQEELEQYYLACQAHEVATALAHGGRSTVQIGRIDTGAAHDQAPHRHLELSLHDVRGADRRFKLLSARLVEHHGRVGLCFMETGLAEQPLYAWRPSGRDGGQDFALLMPEDDPSGQYLQHLGAGDWQFVQGTALAIASHLDSGKAGVSPRWRVAALRLLTALGKMPSRFRFDQLEVQTDATEPRALMVTFRHVLLGERELAALRLSWRPDGQSEAGLQLLAPETSTETPMLACWPVNEAGDWSRRWPVPVGRGDRRRFEQIWHAMCRADRENLLAVLDALPAAARKASELGIAGTTGAADIAASAAAMLQDAHRLVYGSRLRRLWRAARGRILR